MMMSILPDTPIERAEADLTNTNPEPASPLPDSNCTDPPVPGPTTVPAKIDTTPPDSTGEPLEEVPAESTTEPPEPTADDPTARDMEPP